MSALEAVPMVDGPITPKLAEALDHHGAPACLDCDGRLTNDRHFDLTGQLSCVPCGGLWDLYRGRGDVRRLRAVPHRSATPTGDDGPPRRHDAHEQTWRYRLHLRKMSNARLGYSPGPSPSEQLQAGIDQRAMERRRLRRLYDAAPFRVVP